MNTNMANRIFLGFVLIAAGVLFLLDRAGQISMDIGELIADYWPVVIIYFSAAGLFNLRRMKDVWVGSYFWNLVGIAIGLYFLGRNLDMIHIGIGGLIPYVFPALLIFFGIRLIFPPGKSRKNRKQFHSGSTCKENGDSRNRDEWGHSSSFDIGFPKMEPIPDEPISDFDEKFAERFGPLKDDIPEEEEAGSENIKKEEPPRLGKQKACRRGEDATGWSSWGSGMGTDNRCSFIGDIKIGQDYFELKPMNISLFIGDTVIDLTKAHIPAGETKINVSSFIGDVKVYIPNDLDLEVSVISSLFIGDNHVLDRYEGGILKNMNYIPPGYQEAEKRIRIHVSSFIGDVLVQRVG